MTQEEKILLLKDLCARLPYGVIMTNVGLLETHYPLTCEDLHDAMFNDGWDDVPYLRSIPSMSEKEKEEYFNVCDEDIETLSTAMDAPDIIISDKGRTQGYVAYKELEWLYEHHFDFIRKVGDKYTTLTDMGLALKAPDGMYNN